MTRKRKIHKPLSATLDEVLDAVANTYFDPKKKKVVKRKINSKKSN